MIYSGSLSSALVEDGNLLAFVEEERLSRVKKRSMTNGRNFMENLQSKLRGKGGSSLDSTYPHHLQHAAAAYYQSGYKDAVILVMDGMDEAGEVSIAIYKAKNGKFEEVRTYPAEYSLGLMYNVGASYCGLTENGYEGHPGRLMGLATYSKKDWDWYQGYFLKVDVQTGKVDSESIGVENLGEAIFNSTGKAPIRKFSFTHADVAGYVQHLFEESVWSLLAFIKNLGFSKNLIITGGCGLNATMNGKIIRSRLWDNFFVPPLCEDTGNLLGLMILEGNLSLNKPLVYNTIAPRYDPAKDILIPIDSDKIAEWIRKGTPVAWFEGGSEYGPRALGHRSILADASLPQTKYLVNEIKGREYWRPFAPIVLDSYFRTLFHSHPKASPLFKYMLATEYVKTACQYMLPAVLAPDGTTRPQALFDTRENHTLYHFMADHAMPFLLNTSLNGPGEPIIETLAEAKRFCAKVGIPLVYVVGSQFYTVQLSSLNTRGYYAQINSV